MEKLKLIKCWKTLLLLIGISLFTGKIYAQDGTLRGRVTDSKGEALIGATVRVGGQTQGTTTDISGNFALPGASNATSINVSYVGFVTLNVAVKPGTTNLGTIILVNDANNLSEVVIVGYGTQTKRDVAGATATVDAKSLAEQPATNVANQLIGKVAGLDVQSGGSGMGATPSIRLRGSRTIGAPLFGNGSGQDAPLIVVDGIPFSGSINDINPQAIKSLDILKDASSTAIYGSRGSNGVILITTNRGRVGRSIVTLNSYYGLRQVTNPLRVLNRDEYIQFKADATSVQGIQNSGYNGGVPAYNFSPKEQAGIAAGNDTNWQKILFQNAYVADQNLGVSGGTEATQFNVNAGYRVETDVEPNQRRERYALQAQIDHRISKSIVMGANITNNLTFNNGAGGGQNGIAARLSPLVNPFLPDGSLDIFPSDGTIDASNSNPLYPKYNGVKFYNNTRAFHTFSNVYAEITIVKGLKYKLTGGFDFQQSLNQFYNGVNQTGILLQANTTAGLSNNSSYKYVIDNLLTYDNTFGKHHVTFTGLFSNEKSNSQNSNFNAMGIPSDAQRATNLALANQITGSGGSYSETGLISQMARVNYSYDGRYVVNATIRNDANSTLAEGRKYLAYPAVGAAWNVSNEKWMQPYTWVDNLKLRLGFGVTSNGPLGGSAYQTLGNLGTRVNNNDVRYQYGGTSSGNANGLLVTTLVNESLTWQKTAEWNLGMDFSILKSRLSGSIELYSQKTTGILVQNILPPSLGANSQISNLGTSASKGLEIALSSVNIQKNGFSWATDANIAFSRERIVELPNGSQANIGAGTFVGWPLNVVYDAKKIGIWQLSDSPGTDPVKTAAQGGPVYLPVTAQTSPVQYPGQIRVEDVNKDGKITDADNQIIGTFQPQYTFGLTNRFTYKAFDLSVVINGRMGMTSVIPYVTAGGTTGWGFLGTGRSNQPYLDYWTPANPNAYFPGPNGVNQSPPFQSTVQYFDGSWIKARSINFGYTVPSKYLTKVGISSLRVYFNVSNPFVIYAPIRKYAAGMDPEGGGNIAAVPTNNGGFNGRATGINFAEYKREFILGINLRF